MINNAAIVDALPEHWVAKVRPYSPAPANAEEGGGGQRQQRPGDQRRHRLGRLVLPAAAHMPGDHRDDHAGEHAAGDDLEEHVRQRVRGVVGIAKAGVADGLGEHQGAAEADDARGEGQAGQAQRDRAESSLHARPSWSSRRSHGVFSITAVKLTRSLARFRPATPMRASTRAGRGSTSAATVATRGAQRVGPAVAEHRLRRQVAR